MPLHIVHHPVAEVLLGKLRDKRCGAEEFARLGETISTIVILEATRNLSCVEAQIETPLEPMMVKEIRDDLVGVCILRAGAVMQSAFCKLFPNCPTGTLGLRRSEQTAEAKMYSSHLPALTSKHVVLMDPMLATGGSAVLALETLTSLAPSSVTLLTLVAAPEGVAKVTGQFPSVSVFTVGLDRELDGNKFIRPGLGDFGDRMHGA